MVPLSVAQLFQLYAPLAGLLVLAFWVGKLSQKVEDVIRRMVKMEKAEEGVDGRADRLVKVETTMAAMEKTLEHLNRILEGISRQLANIATRNMEFRSDKSA